MYFPLQKWIKFHEISIKRQTRRYYRMLWYFLLIQIYGLQKGGVFSEDSPTYYWMWNVHITSQINSVGIRDIYPEVLLRIALSVNYFRNKLGGIIICHGTTKRRLPFSYNI